MTRALKVPANRSLLDRPQRLGILPTIWFWNDWGVQRLILPFILISLPVFLLLDMLRMWLGLEPWVTIAVNLVLAFLMMGMIERYVRAQARRSVTEIAGSPRLVIQDTQIGSALTGRELMVSMAIVSGILTVLLLLQASPAVLGATAVYGVALIVTTLRRSMSRARSLASDEKSEAPGLREPQQGKR
jgi:hypothetical protein